MKRTNVWRGFRLHVMKDKCSTCIFRPGNPMHLESSRLKQMVEQAQSRPGGTIPCHQTLDLVDNAVCAGYWEAYSDDDKLLRMAKEGELIERDEVK